MTRWIRLVVAVVLALSAAAVVAGRPTPVSAGGCNTWTGAVSNKWSVAGNWSLGTPVNGQALCFPAHTGGNTSLDDDITGLSVNGITALGNYEVTGTSLTIAGTVSGSNFNLILQNPVVLSGVVTGGGFSLNGAVSGGGSLDVVGPWPVNVNGASNTFTGGVTVDGSSNGYITDGGSLGTGVVTVQSGGVLAIVDTNVDNPLVLAGAGAGPRKFALACYNASNLNGPITLTADTTIFDYDSSVGPAIASVHTCRVNGMISGGFRLTLEQQMWPTTPGPGWEVTGTNTYTGGTQLSTSAIGSYVVGGGPAPFGTGPVTITAAQPSDLFSTGTVGDVTLDAPAGVLAASDGETPGTLTTGSLTLNTGTLVSEIAAPTASSLIRSTGVVTLGGARLAVDLRYQPSVGTAFTLIHNTSGSAISGTFAGLPEGASFSAGTAEFGITYSGNGGDDVVVTVLSVIAVPPVGAGAGWALALILVGSGLALLLAPGVRARKPDRAGGAATGSRGSAAAD